MFVVFLFVGLVLFVYVEKVDQNKLINVEVDNLIYDDLKQVMVVIGNVVIMKGMIIIKGDCVEVCQDLEGYQYVMLFGSGKKYVMFCQKCEGFDEYIDGDVECIDYDGKQDFIMLIIVVIVCCLQGMLMVVDIVYGSVIMYDGQCDFYIVKGGKDVVVLGNLNGCVCVMLLLKNGGFVLLNGVLVKLLLLIMIQGVLG